MPYPTLEMFKRDAQAQGFDEILERKWPPSTVLETHTHPFAVKALVTEGEMWLIVGEDERHLLPGGTSARRPGTWPPQRRRDRRPRRRPPSRLLGTDPA